MAPYSQSGGDWTDPEVSRFVRRESAFLEHGLDVQGAEKLAQQLLYRDRPESGDDRRVCFECAHLSRLRCTAGHPAMPFVMQRCPGFALKGVKA